MNPLSLPARLAGVKLHVPPRRPHHDRYFRDHTVVASTAVEKLARQND